MQIEWQLTIVFPVETINELKKQTIVIVDKDKNQLAIDFLWENVDLITDLKQWATYNVSFATRINVTNRVFNRITGKSITPAELPTE